MSKERLRRIVVIAICTLAGVVVGTAGDFFGVERIPGFTDVLLAITLAPVTVTMGGNAVSVRPLAGFFFYAGLAFWPVYAVLAWCWIAKGVRWVLPMSFFWTAQGFFQVVSRLHLIMSA